MSTQKHAISCSLLTVEQLNSTGAFLNGELERLDQTIHEPLVDISWSRDIDLREDVSMGDEMSSYTNSAFAATGGFRPGGKAWIASNSTEIQGVAVDIGKTSTPLNLWGVEVKWTLPELENAKMIGRPIDTVYYDNMKLKWNLDLDEQTYIGDSDYSTKGLFNFGGVTPANVPNGASGSSLWVNKSPQEILTDVNTMLTTTWENSAWAVMPNRLMLPPAQFGYVSSMLISDAGNQSILKYLNDNNIVKQSGGTLELYPQKWLIGRGGNGAQGIDRMVCYTKDKKRVRLPIVPLQRTPIEYRSLWQITTYYGKFGSLEAPYISTLGYSDGI